MPPYVPPTPVDAGRRDGRTCTVIMSAKDEPPNAVPTSTPPVAAAGAAAAAAAAAAAGTDEVGVDGRCPICLDPYRDRTVLNVCFRASQGGGAASRRGR
jgi:hypothetical protein